MGGCENEFGSKVEQVNEMERKSSQQHRWELSYLVGRVHLPA